MNLKIKILAMLAAMSFAGAASYAQEDQSQEKPKPAAKSYGPIGAEDRDQNQHPDMMVPDNRALTGIQQLTVGSPSEQHSYWVPGVSYYNFIQSNRQAQGGGGAGWISTSYLAGNLSLLENSGHSQ